MSGAAFQIDSYERLYEEVSRCENTQVFNGWLQCDCRPFKQALLNTIKRWSFMFKHHLSDHVISRWVPACRARPHPRAPEGHVRGMAHALPGEGAVAAGCLLTGHSGSGCQAPGNPQELGAWQGGLPCDE